MTDNMMKENLAASIELMLKLGKNRATMLDCKLYANELGLVGRAYLVTMETSLTRRSFTGKQLDEKETAETILESHSDSIAIWYDENFGNSLTIEHVSGVNDMGWTEDELVRVYDLEVGEGLFCFSDSNHTLFRIN